MILTARISTQAESKWRRVLIFKDIEDYIKKFKVESLYFMDSNGD